MVAMISRPRIRYRRNRYMVGSDANDKMVNCESLELSSEHTKVQEGLKVFDVDGKWSCGSSVSVPVSVCFVCPAAHR